VLFSLCYATLFTILPSKVEHTGKMGVVRICIINTILLGAARRRVSDFWSRKAKIPLPGVRDYNEAIGETQEVKFNMAFLVASWVAVGGFAAVLWLGGEEWEGEVGVEVVKAWMGIELCLV
jgi:hypothetical protein